MGLVTAYLQNLQHITASLEPILSQSRMELIYVVMSRMSPKAVKILAHHSLQIDDDSCCLPSDYGKVPDKLNDTAKSLLLK